MESLLSEKSFARAATVAQIARRPSHAIRRADPAYFDRLTMNKQTTSRLTRTAAVLVAAILPACSTSNEVARQTAPTPAKAASAKPAKTVPVVATAYGASAKCNSKWAGRNAIGGRLKSGALTSAAADWSRFPVGTKFRVKETGRVYVVDDYGSAMVGKDKVDLFKTNYREVYRWGVRNVQLEIIEWGDFEKSLAILKPRSRSRHVKSMVQSLEAKLNGTTTRDQG
jgi:3D (Asp-Asp-Asp) domain-containing protein